MARPKIELDERAIELAASLGGNNSEIADAFECDEGTIRKRFSEILSKARAKRKMKLKEMLWQACENGNITAMIWMSKQELGYSDKVEQNNNQTIVIKEKPVDTSPKTDSRAGLDTSPISSN